VLLVTVALAAPAVVLVTSTALVVVALAAFVAALVALVAAAALTDFVTEALVLFVTPKPNCANVTVAPNVAANNNTDCLIVFMSFYVFKVSYGYIEGNFVPGFKKSINFF
jgi:hypothetical protein